MHRLRSMTGRSVSHLADSELILLLPAAQADTSQPHAQSHENTFFLRENDSNFNGIQCKRQLIIIYVVPDEACTACV